MFFLHFYNFSRLGYFLALILVLPLAACSSGDDGLSGGNSGGTGLNVPALTWIAPSEREDGTVLILSEIAGFRVHYGTSSGNYSDTIEINDHTTTQAVLDSIPSGTYYVVVTTLDTDGRESIFSAEVLVTL